MKKQLSESAHNQAVTGKKESMLAHFMELRRLLIHCAIAVLVGFVGTFYAVCDRLLTFIETPIRERGIEIIYTAINEALTTQLKVSLVAGIVIVSPFIVWQVWRFIRPALYDNEIRLFRTLFLIALALFLTGIVFCYSYVYELAINFFVISGEGIAKPMLSIDKYVGFLFSFLLPFGLVFELPVVVYMISRRGLVSYKALAKNRKYVFFAIFILAAILTPPDVISQVMLGLPMYALYEVSIQVARLTRRKGEETKS